mgnify:CR=1 FL=1
MDIRQKDFFCSWSGGKDSCLALYYALQQGGLAKKLLTVMIENGERSHSHGLSLALLKKQAELLEIPLMTVAATWESYEENFIDALQAMRAEGIKIGVYGDIDLENHRNWVLKVSQAAGLEAYHPLWQKPRREVLAEFIAAGFKAVVVAVDGRRLSKEFLGRLVDRQLLQEFEQTGIDPAGENGEYHTVVIGGPIFKAELKIELQEQLERSGYWFQNIKII